MDIARVIVYHRDTAPYIQSVTYEAGLLEYEDFPRTEEPIHILGTTYSALHELEDIKKDVASRLWFTYRWGFAPIGGDGPTSDQGWGCMLRCGQMMLAEALVRYHLGRDWRWYEGKNDKNYYDILKMFVDKKNSCYSIHQIANMGASEGKHIGQWFGPNTIAQVIKKLSVYDVWTNMKVHVALDNTIIVEDVKTLCKIPCTKCDKLSNSTENTNDLATPAQNCSSCQKHLNSATANANHKTPSYSSQSGRPTIFDRVKEQNLTANAMPAALDRGTLNAQSCHISCDDRCGCCGGSVQDGTKRKVEHKDSSTLCGGPVSEHWRPLLLVVPLRLGLSDINPVYIEALKTCFTLKQSVGIIGGKPNQAHWFIGVVGNELIFLDPHTKQPVEDVSRDESYHCPYSCRMKITHLDPSIALAFFCASEAEFNEFYHKAEMFICQEKTRIFEIHLKRPRHWPPLDYCSSSAANETVGACSADFDVIDRQYDTDEEFELL